MTNEQIISLFGSLTESKTGGFVFIPNIQHAQLSPVLYANPDRDHVAKNLAETLRKIEINITLDKILKK